MSERHASDPLDIATPLHPLLQGLAADVYIDLVLAVVTGSMVSHALDELRERGELPASYAAFVAEEATRDVVHDVVDEMETRLRYFGGLPVRGLLDCQELEPGSYEWHRAKIDVADIEEHNALMQRTGINEFIPLQRSRDDE